MGKYGKIWKIWKICQNMGTHAKIDDTAMEFRSFHLRFQTKPEKIWENPQAVAYHLWGTSWGIRAIKQNPPGIGLVFLSRSGEDQDTMLKKILLWSETEHTEPLFHSLVAFLGCTISIQFLISSFIQFPSSFTLRSRPQPKLHHPKLHQSPTPTASR